MLLLFLVLLTRFFNFQSRVRLLVMMTVIRWFLGKLILTLDALFQPKGIIREPMLQAKIDAETKDWRIYQLVACPFCVKVRRELTRLSIKIPLKDVKNEEFQKELMSGGKEDQVPCLMISAASGGHPEWMYESSEIISFLRKRFSTV